ncbi:hypothetical protein AB2Z78_000005 [Salmonella enterica]
MLSGYICIGEMMGVIPRPVTSKKDGKEYMMHDVGIKIQRQNAYGSLDTVTETFGIPMNADSDKAASYYNSLKGRVVAATFEFGVREQKESKQWYKFVNILSAVEYKPDGKG